jgi:polyhydroxyalkanoate synthase
VISAATLSKIRSDVDRHALRARNGIRHVSGGSFVRVGQTPSQPVWSRDSVRLWRYESDTRTISPPVLLIPSLINRSYIFDLYPGNSFVERLIEAGMDVFAVDWGEAQPADATNTLETYVDGYLPSVIDATREASGASDVTAVGYCLGGLLVLLYAAGRRQSGMRNLITLATPIDFDEMGLLVAMVRDGRLEIDDVLDEDGNVPGDVIRRVIQLRRPTGGLVTYANLLENLWSDAYMAGYQAMSRWVRESVPVPGALARQLTEQLIRSNELAGGRMVLGGRIVDLAQVSAACLVVVAQDDDMVPLACAAPLTGLLTGCEVDELRPSGGHISLMVGRRAATVTIPQVIEWVHAHSDARPGEA